jgi:hypothetical protein
VLAAAVASYSGQVIAGMSGWPLWALVLVTVLPWTPILAVDAVRAYRESPWLGALYGLVVVELAHLGEHLAQMTQIHLLGRTGTHARGIFGALDIEWVHFGWNTAILIAVLVLLRRFPANSWLWLAASVAVWHQIEHFVILLRYVGSGVPGDPGLLSEGGSIAGGLPFARPDVHFIYNLIETIPLVVAFLAQRRRTSSAVVYRRSTGVTAATPRGSSRSLPLPTT